MNDKFEILPGKVCFTWGSSCYHRAAFVEDTEWWRAGRGYTRSVCGCIDSATFCHFWTFDFNEEKVQRRIRDGRLRPCKRCYPNNTAP